MERLKRIWTFIRKHFPELLWEWWGMMCGAISILVTFLGFSFHGTVGYGLLVLGFVGLWVMIFSLQRKSIALIESTKPQLVFVEVANATLGEHPNRTKFFRVLIRNKGVLNANQCIAKLVCISKNGSVLMAQDERLLPFVPGHHADAFSKRIAGKDSEKLDLLIVSEQNVVRLATTPPEIANRDVGGTVFNEHGVYDLHVSISSSSSVTVTHTLKFDWAGTWGTSELRL